MRIYLIRHGRQNSPLCNVNVPLSDAGRRQAELLGERLKKESIDAVWSSDLIRACETADIINEKIQAPRIIREGLREISFGELEGLSDDVIMERYADFFAARATMKEDLPYPGGENAADVIRRAVPVMDEIAKSGAETVAVVTHGGRDPEPCDPLSPYGRRICSAAREASGKLRDHGILLPGVRRRDVVKPF